MASTAWSLTGSKDAIIGKSSGSDLTAALETGTNPSDATPSPTDDEEEVGPESWWYYHLMMVVCTFYMAMLLTDWSDQSVDGAPSGSSGSLGAHSVSLTNFWVKICSQWVCLSMYAWTLLAPYLLRNVRDFGVEFDFD